MSTENKANEEQKQNVERISGYSQVCVWPGTVLNSEGRDASEDDIEKFENFMWERFGARVQYLEEVKTAPDYEGGHPVEGTGGRNDLLFAVHEDDIGKFALPRLQMGIRWIEDAMGKHNGTYKLYPKRLEGYMSWDPSCGNDEVDDSDPERADESDLGLLS